MPGFTCVVDFCQSKSRLGSIMHRFPADGPRRQKWIEFVRGAGRTDWMPCKTSRICGLHFEPGCRRRIPPDSESAHHLHADAIPTIFYPAACPLSEGSHPKRPRLQASTDAETEAAVSPPMSVDIGAYCEIDEAENAGGEVNVDAQVQCRVELRSKATQVARKLGTKVAKVQTSQSLKEVACQADLELPEILLVEVTWHRALTRYQQCMQRARLHTHCEKTVELNGHMDSMEQLMLARHESLCSARGKKAYMESEGDAADR
ncbi:hypothetical protein HPB52_018099 [Rhipicephalus sanguineus]|uniref:THAP-type domain-containing protein n=1 Tax=Rhipicephalus sanguineus TaxID=34632 RepID=A0A9D4QGJ8_RHISA|nr:hypothetical protein HPB52_018099 [Rhipicephalus sanguineus]